MVRPLNPYDADSGPRAASKPKEQKWKPGDVVRLKSGSPPMTVETYDSTGNYALWGVRCIWFSPNPAFARPERECFHEDALESAKETP